MRSLLLVIGIYLMNILPSLGQYWNPIEQPILKNDVPVITNATKAQWLELDYSRIEALLYQSPQENLTKNKISKNIIKLPFHDGSFKEFYIVESSVMQAKLQAKYPHLRSYKGYCKSDPGINVRLNINGRNLHAAIHGTAGVHYIDEVNGKYIAYDVHSVTYDMDPNIPLCGVQDEHQNLGAHEDLVTRNITSGETISFRTYRLAISCTGEYGSWKGSVERVLEDMVTGVNRMNQIFENELSMRLILVNDNDKILFFDRDTDPYTNTANGGAMISVNTATINNRIGSNAYDLGHVYSTSCNVGGIAALSSMCTAIKGNGCTCHYRNDIDYMAAHVTSHEIGHQMSAQHTFNFCRGDNESLGNGFEPGSGSTIMSYGGLCGNNNVVPVGDDYYHNASLGQIYNHLRDGGTADGCAMKEETDNFAPEISLDYPNKFSIPTKTYFVLKGSATDANNDPLTYVWEQMNAGPRSALGSPMGNAPNFRSFPPSPNPERFFVQPKYILAGVGDKNEVLPRESKTMEFNFVVRDNHMGGGTAVWEGIRFDVVPDADGKEFKITNFDAPKEIFPGMTDTIKWEVAHTAKSPINCSTVDLYYYAGGSSDFSTDKWILLKKDLPNTGSAEFQFPNVVQSKVRLILKASNSIFFTINKRNLEIQEPSDPTLLLSQQMAPQKSCNTSDTISISALGYGGLEGDISLKILSDLPEGLEVNVPMMAKVGDEIKIIIYQTDASMSISTPIEIEAVSPNQDTTVATYYWDYVSSDHSQMKYVTPEADATGVPLLPTISWDPSPNASSYVLEVSKSPQFETDELVIKTTTTATDFTVGEILDKNTVYFWRVIPNNRCGSSTEYSPIHVFATEVLSCSVLTSDELPKPISSGGTPLVKVPFSMPNAGKVVDVNVKDVTIEHSNNKDLTISLVSPDETEVILVNRKCNQRNILCSFDDDSAIDVACPLNSNKTYKPQQALSAFVGLEMQGEWMLHVKDNNSGNGGRINSLGLEICSNSPLAAPQLVKNDSLYIKPSTQKIIYDWDLKAVDSDNEASEIRYTLLSTPKHGELIRYEDVMEVGDQFTQYDIDNYALYFKSFAEESDDNFDFIVDDNNGGLIGKQSFGISIAASNPTSTQDNILEGVVLYPNPTAKLLHIDLPSDEASIATVYTMLGKVVATQQLAGKNTSLDMHSLSTGMYYIRIQQKNKYVLKKIQKI